MTTVIGPFVQSGATFAARSLRARLLDVPAWPHNRLRLLDQAGELDIAVIHPPRRYRREPTLAHVRLETEPTVPELFGKVRPLFFRTALLLDLEYRPHDARRIRDCSH